VNPQVGRLLSVNVGVPRDIEWEGRVVRTAVWKEAVDGRRMVRRLNVDGDAQGDTDGHGGPNRAVFVYQIDSYRYWQEVLGRGDFTFGQFGENFTVEGLTDDAVCIGDQFRIGSALLEISQPRVTCYRVGIRMGEPQMPSMLVAHHRPGFYFRVLEEGEVGAGDRIERVVSGPEQMSVAEIDGLLYLPHRSRRDLVRASRIPALSEGWQGSFRDLLERAPDKEAVPPAWDGMRELRVVGIERESAGVVSIRLVPGDGRPAPAARPGQFLSLRLRPTPDAAPLLRTYSLSGPPGSDSYRISVKLEPHGEASTYLHTQLSVGDVIEAGAPRGSFVLRGGDLPVVLISAGVGATPVLAMLHVLASERSARQVWWFYGARDADEHPFAQETRALLGQLAKAHHVICYSHPGPDDRGFDVVGRLTLDVLARAGAPDDADFYLCGPTSFMREMAAGLAGRGIPPDRIAREVFGPVDSQNPGVVNAPPRPPHPPAGHPGTGPMISFSRSSLSTAWDPTFASLLELAEACDVPVRFSCRTGVCHSCETGLVSGKINYRPDPLELPDRGSALICCSQPDGEVTLDL
jgi:ferredoxin-NADP reductase/MOSC domain-containing protein YiiM/ferredoxin